MGLYDFITLGLLLNAISLAVIFVFTLLYSLLNFSPTDYIFIKKEVDSGNKASKNHFLYNLIPFFSFYYMIIFFIIFVAENQKGFKAINDSFYKTDKATNLFKLKEK